MDPAPDPQNWGWKWLWGGNPGKKGYVRMLKAGRDLERKGQELDMNQEEVGDSERRREMKCFFCLSSLVTTGKGVGEGKRSQDQSGSLPDNYFQVRTVGGLVWGSARTFIWTCPKLSMPIGMKQGCGKCLRDSLSLSQNSHSCGYSSRFRQVLLRTWRCCGQGI